MRTLRTLSGLEYDNPHYEAPKTTGGGGFKITYIYPEIQGTPPTIRGWECPKCGRIHSPWVEGCRHCNDRVEELHHKIETAITNAVLDPNIEYSDT